MAAYAVIMLAGGVAPCIDCGPINKIKLQQRNAGYRIDDFVVHAGDATEAADKRLLVQVKLGIKFTAGDTDFRDTIIAAWRDFHDTSVFDQNRDQIAIVTGPLSATDIDGIRTILDLARTQSSASEFFTDVNRSKLYSKAVRDKLAAVRKHINTASGSKPSDEEVFRFLRRLHVLGYDLDVRSGTSHSLLRTVIGCFQSTNPLNVWARILEEVTAFNPMAGTLTVENFVEDIRDSFKPRVTESMPRAIASTIPPQKKIDWNESDYADSLVVANLLGGWNEQSATDMAIVASLSNEPPSEWLRQMRRVVQMPSSPLVQAGGVWVVKRRAELWTELAGRIFDEALRQFRQVAVTVLRELNPAFELEPEQRYAAQIYGKVTSHSASLRNGVAETLALLGTELSPLPNARLSAGQTTAQVVIRETLEGADWQLWGSLDYQLPTLAEAAPDTFLASVEAALRVSPSPFDKLFSDERSAMNGGNYITGLLWALETLAWEEKYLVRVAVILAVLAARDPGGNWANRPINSLKTIFLPWFPQTLASVDKRTVAVKTVIKERHEVGWKLLKALLPQHHGVSSGSHKPRWRSRLREEESRRPTEGEYWEQVASYTAMAVEIVKSDTTKLEDLIDMIDSLEDSAVDEVLLFVQSESVQELPEEQKAAIWTAMSAVVRKHRRYATAKWALPSELVDRIHNAAVTLTPVDPAIRYRVLFSKDNWALYDDPEDWKTSEERLAQKRHDAIAEIHAVGQIAAVTAFAEHVENAWNVGYEIAVHQFPDATADWLRPLVLSPSLKLRELAQGFAGGMSHRVNESWINQFQLDGWAKEEISQLLTYLPFRAATWETAKTLLGDDAKEYWERVPVFAYQAVDDDYTAIDALQKHGRPLAVVDWFAARIHQKLPVDPNRALNALIGGLTTTEQGIKADSHDVATVIKALQDDPTTDRNKLKTVEWAYLVTLEHTHVTTPKELNSSLAKDPNFFCEIIRFIFRSDKEREADIKPDRTDEERAFGLNAYRLLGNWNIVPGTQSDGSIDEAALVKWVDAVKSSLDESGHLDIGLQKAGEVFIHAPGDPAGLFINHAVANVLNREDMEELRRGYEMATYNARGAHFVDPTGAPEKELAEDFRKKAETAENAGYHRFAVTLRAIAADYLREAERNILRAKSRDFLND